MKQISQRLKELENEKRQDGQRVDSILFFLDDMLPDEDPEGRRPPP